MLFFMLDGIRIKFFQIFWNIIGKDYILMINQTLAKNVFLKALSNNILFYFTKERTNQYFAIGEISK